MDGMQLPYVTRCYRAEVLERPTPGTGTGTMSGTGDSTADGQAGDGDSTSSEGPDDDMLLIDFR
jgi:hypothetical protein